MGEQVDVGQIVSFIRWSGVVASLGVVVATAIALRFAGQLVERLGKRFAHRRLVLNKVWSIARFAVYLLASALVLALSFQLNQTVITLVGGTLAVAVGFALRDLVAAMIAGVTIMVDRPFQVGDRVQYAGEYGDILAIGLRSVRMLTLDDNVVTIPNNKVLTDVTSCGNYGALDMQVGVSVWIAVDQDLELARQLMLEALATSRFTYLHKPVMVWVEQVIREESVVVHLRGKAWVLDTRYEKAFQTDVTLATMSAFRAHGVLAPRGARAAGLGAA